ncbi:hypothetical protein ONS95_006981 [Cadophora gregata]|uniref:uncharacterized protein n=1 Tax=Cadophora gregata TaxID=51156 RepID=UPI0026DDA733|nr:uncharacterized protein ONS95_006981 [Cadophora gregata]KAK0100520.1 hypothetical protein ONS95_006981 [Cadophora gregata]KAK0117480.1 hypothetical protein ONS96_013310 [Cadophora gregata f. sp. sojae]
MSYNVDNTNLTDTYEEEEEVEITDDEAGSVNGEQYEGVTTPPGSVATPGKVKPTEEVKNMKMSSPQTTAGTKAKGQGLPSNKNPFTTYGSWTEDTMSQIEIVVPVLTGKNESTNELTRSTKPEMRYWKAPIVFKYGNYTSTTMPFDNVQIPYHTGKGYGSNFVYICLPGFAASKFSEAAKVRRPTVVNEKSLQPDRNRWWKVANKVEESFGVVNAETKRFQKKSLEVIFDATNSGISASVILSFMSKANTDSMEPLKPTTSCTISINLERAFYINVRL